MKRIAQITDLHIDDFLAREFQIDARKNIESALSLAQCRGISEVILTGDLGAPESAPWLFETIKGYGFDFQVALGNHDNPADYQKFDFLKTLIKGNGFYFSKMIDDIDFECIFLDSSTEEIDEIQFEWLRHQISRSKDLLLVFIHHPILDCGNTIIDQLYPLKNRDAVRHLLIESQREVFVFCGHCHYRNSDEIRDGNLHQFPTPSTFGQIKPYGEKIESDPGYIAYREIWIKDGRIQTEVVEVK
uniref:Metallophosphoesterase n=1 Tax=uncultured bacterium pAX1 TaxID=1781156 RepID=A0A1C9U4H6_9BACT|nr:metallophosphoesterase [uncultured bacterium pAX1]